MNASAPIHDAPAATPHLQGGVLRFFVLVVVLSIPFYLVGAGALPVPMTLPVSALAAVCPLVAAVILVSRQDRPNGVRRLLRRAFDHKRIRNKIWYLPCILLMPAISVLAYAVMRLTDRPLPEPHIAWLTAPVLFAAFFTAAIGEELGWMGYAVDRVQQRRSALATGLIMGAAWALFHAVPLVQAGRAPAWMAWWALNTVAMRVLMVWIYNNAGQSVLTAILFHTTSNVAWSLFPNDGSHFDPAIVGSITAVTALVVTVLWGAETLTRERHAGRVSP